MGVEKFDDESVDKVLISLHERFKERLILIVGEDLANKVIGEVSEYLAIRENINE